MRAWSEREPAAEIRDVVLPYFKRNRGRLTHKRLSEELAKYETTSGKRSEAGKRGGAKKASENKVALKAIASVEESNCSHNQNQNQNSSEDKSSDGGAVVGVLGQIASLKGLGLAPCEQKRPISPASDP